MPPLVRFPAGPITPHGAWHILHDRRPQMGLLSYDNTVSFNLLGGAAIPDRTMPGRVEIKDLKGLIPPWKRITQKGATQDGDSFVTALGDPIEVEMGTRIVGKDPADCRRVQRYLIDSIDSKQESELWWFTHQMGRWWAKVRWLQAPADSINAVNKRSETLGLRLVASSGYWQSYPTVDEFVFNYVDANDNFDTDDADDLGAGWNVALSGGGTGGLTVDDSQAVPTLSGARTAVARKAGYTSAGDNMVSEIELGTLGQWFYPTDAGFDLWVRINNSGTAGTSGVRLRVERNKMRLSYFVAGVETVIRERILIIPPLTGEKWRLVAGDDTNPRLFRVMRGKKAGATIWAVKESGTGSPVGASNRSVGFGLWTTTTTDAPSLRGFSAGINAATVSQQGFIELANCGDQDMWIDYTVFGPATKFKFWNGPGAGADEYVEFGPILAGQVMQLRTDPRRRGVVDMTATPPTPQQLTAFQKALSDFLGFLTGNNATPLAEEIKSKFGILAPQGNPYSLLKGRWSKPLLPKSPGKPAELQHIKVEIVGGNADSKIIASGTPLRRMPY